MNTMGNDIESKQLSPVRELVRVFHRRGWWLPKYSRVQVIDRQTKPWPYQKLRFDSHERDGVVVVEWSMLPTCDKMFIHYIETLKEFRGKGYAVAALRYLYLEHDLPIVPVEISASGRPFWTNVEHQYQRVIPMESETYNITLTQERAKHPS
jgi:hypothetical protein